MQEKGPVQPSQNDESLNSQYLRVRLPNITSFSFFLEISSFHKSQCTLQGKCSCPCRIGMLLSNLFIYIYKDFLISECSPRRSPRILTEMMIQLDSFCSNNFCHISISPHKHGSAENRSQIRICGPFRGKHDCGVEKAVEFR